MKHTVRRGLGLQQSGLATLPHSQSKKAIARDIGPVVYFFRTKDDLVKIGYTANIAERVFRLGGWNRLLAIQPGTLADERDAHERFTGCLARGREYFHPFPELIAYINEIRGAMGVPELVW